MNELARTHFIFVKGAKAEGLAMRDAGEAPGSTFLNFRGPDDGVSFNISYFWSASDLLEDARAEMAGITLEVAQVILVSQSGEVLGKVVDRVLGVCGLNPAEMLIVLVVCVFVENNEVGILDQMTLPAYRAPAVSCRTS